MRKSSSPLRGFGQFRLPIAPHSVRVCCYRMAGLPFTSQRMGVVLLWQESCSSSVLGPGQQTRCGMKPRRSLPSAWLSMHTVWRWIQ